VFNLITDIHVQLTAVKKGYPKDKISIDLKISLQEFKVHCLE